MKFILFGVIGILIHIIDLQAQEAIDDVDILEESTSFWSSKNFIFSISIVFYFLLPE